MTVSLHFVHGWGFDADLWGAVAALLPQWPQTRAERGYFGHPDEAEPTGRCLVVAHSHGALRMLLDPPPGCIGLVAINGFDRFGQERVLTRMIARAADNPDGVLAAFRVRCGVGEAPRLADPARLLADLAHMRDADARAASAAWPHPLVAVHGGADPILPAPVRDAAFAATRRLHAITHAPGGHLLPLTEPALCADAIRALAEQLA